MAQQELITLKVGFNVPAAAKEIAAPALKAQAQVAEDAERKVRLAERTRRLSGTAEEKEARRRAAVEARLAKEQAAEQRKAAAEVAKQREELDKRRRAFIIAGIEDERERRLALVDAQTEAESKQVRALLQARLQAGEITRRQFQESIKEFDTLLDRTRQVRVNEIEQRFSGAMDGLSTSGQRANLTVMQVARSIDQAQRFTSGWQSGVRGLSTQMIPLLNQLTRLRTDAEQAGQTVTQQLVGAFKGPAGLITVLNLAATAAVLFGSKAVEAFRTSGEEADQARSKYEDALRALVRFRSEQDSTFVGTQEQARLRVQRTAAELAELRQEIAQLNREREAIVPREALPFEDPAAVNRAAREARARITRDIEAIEQRIAARQAEFDQAKAFLDEEAARADVAQRARQDGLEEEINETQRATRAVSGVRDDAARRDAEIASVTAAARLELIGTSLDRELEQIRRAEAERLATVAGIAEAEQLVRDAAELQRVTARARAADRMVQIERDRVEAEAQFAERRELLFARNADERAAIEERYTRARIARLVEATAQAGLLLEQQSALLAGLGIEESDYLEELARGVEQLRRQRVDAELSAADAARQRREQEVAAERRFQEQMRDIRDRVRRFEGTTNQQILSERLAAIETELRSEELAAERRRELYVEEARLRSQLLDDLLRQQAAFRQQAERYARSFINVVSDAARAPRQLTDAEIREEQRRFRSREDQLRESLNRQEISQAEYSDRMAILAEQRKNFEVSVEQERAGFVARLTSGLTDLLIQEGERLLAAVIARGLAQAVFGKSIQQAMAATTAATMQQIAAAASNAATLVSIATVGGAAVAGAGSVVAALGTVRGAALLTQGFAEGGYTGRGGRLEPAGVVHRGEVVMESDIVAGQLSDWLTLRALAQRGFRLDDLFHAAGLPGYADGGAVGVRSVPVSVPLLPARATSADDIAQAVRDAMAPIADEVARLKTSPPPVIVGDAEARSLTGASSRFGARESLPLRRIKPRRR